jgi:hypothetical protein
MLMEALKNQEGELKPNDTFDKLSVRSDLLTGTNFTKKPLSPI